MTTQSARYQLAQRDVETVAAANLKKRELRMAGDTRRTVGMLQDNTLIYEGGYSRRYVDRWSTLSSALTAFGSTAIDAILSKPMTLSANATIPANVALRVTKNGSIALNGFTLTINGFFSAGLFQVFTGSGTVAFGRPSVREVFPEWFGAGVAVSDNSTAIAAAIAAANGIPVTLSTLFPTTAVVNVPAGTIIRGYGWGDNPLIAPTTKATGLQYTGSGTAMSINGGNVSARDFALYSTSASPTKGLYLCGDVNAIESCTFRNLLIYGFTGGNAIELAGINGGYVAYCGFINIRIRNAKKGVYIHDTGGGGGFVNTNQWDGGAISGGAGIFDYAIHSVGGNDNRFRGMSVEPYNSTVGHIVVENNSLASGSIWFDGRIEGSTQLETVPLVRFKAATKDSYLSTTIGISGWIDDLGQNTVCDAGAKSPKLPTHSQNLFINDSFEGVTSGAVPSWTINESGGSGSTFATSAAEVIESMSVLAITIPAGVTLQLRQEPASVDFSKGKSVMFGGFIKTSAAISVQWAAFNTDGVSPATVAGVAYNTGVGYTGTWQFLGGRQNMLAASTVIRPFLSMVNSTGAPVVVYLTAPVCSRGYSFQYPFPSTGSGVLARAAGPSFTGAMAAGSIAATAGITCTTLAPSGILTLGSRMYGKKGADIASAAAVAVGNGTFFEVTGTTDLKQIDSSNWVTGTVITLKFTGTLSVWHNTAGSGANAAIKLKDGLYLLAKADTTLTLVWDGTVWQEVCRKEVSPPSQTFSNAILSVAAGVRFVAQIGTMSASRAVTLPLAATYPRGLTITIVDESGTVTGGNTIVVTAAGSDTIGAGTTSTVNSAYGKVTLASDGTSKWTVVG